MTLPDGPYPPEPDSYVCGTALLPNTPHKLVGVVPLARQETVHHMLLYACGSVPNEAPPGEVVAWKCGEMGTCSGGESTIIYGWGKNAPELMLPEGVGYSVGPGSGIRHIVIQVHYLSPRPKGDRSGVVLRLHPHATPLAAGLLAFASWFSIPPRTPSYLVPNECCYRGHQPLTTFAARVHTHGLGRSVYMTRPWSNGTGGVETIVRRDPQLPQAFVPVEHFQLWPGDRLKTTCDFDSSGVDHSVSVGGTHNDEMCNLYMMLYAPMPFISMCMGGRLEGIKKDSTADLHSHGQFVADPMPTWHPPDSASVGLAAGLGHCTGVTMGRNGSLWGLFRGSRPWLADSFDMTNHVTDKAPIPEHVVVQMEADTGRVIRKWGAGVFFMPHMITVDRHGDIWVVDTGRHQVLKFSPAGKELLVVGTKLTPGKGAKGLCEPTKVAVANDGSFYVADGYCSSRVSKFNRDGTYNRSYEVDKGYVIHSVLLSECDGLLYVASRETSKIFAFAIDGGSLLRSFDVSKHGKPWSLTLGPAGVLLVLCWTQGQTAKLLEVEAFTLGRSWDLPGMEAVKPHDVALGAAAQELTGAADRLFALYVAAICEPDAAHCSSLRKFILSRPDWTAPSPADLLRLTTRTAAKPGPTAATTPAVAGVIKKRVPPPSPGPSQRVTPSPVAAVVKKRVPPKLEPNAAPPATSRPTAVAKGPAAAHAPISVSDEATAGGEEEEGKAEEVEAGHGTDQGGDEDTVGDKGQDGDAKHGEEGEAGEESETKQGGGQDVSSSAVGGKTAGDSADEDGSEQQSGTAGGEDGEEGTGTEADGVEAGAGKEQEDDGSRTKGEGAEAATSSGDSDEAKAQQKEEQEEEKQQEDEELDAKEDEESDAKGDEESDDDEDDYEAEDAYGSSGTSDEDDEDYDDYSKGDAEDGEKQVGEDDSSGGGDAQSMIDADAETWDLVQVAKDAKKRQDSAAQVLLLLLSAIMLAAVVIVVALYVIKRQQERPPRDDAADGAPPRHTRRVTFDGALDEQSGLLASAQQQRRPKHDV